MKVESPALFGDWDCYKIFHRKMGRWQICLKHKISGNRKTLLYSKFLMSSHLDRWLSSDEEVDHLDGNKTNDVLENFEVVTKAENRIRQAGKNLKRLIHLDCPTCGTAFVRERRQTHLSKGGVRTFCSRQCSGKFHGNKALFL